MATARRVALVIGLFVLAVANGVFLPSDELGALVGAVSGAAYTLFAMRYW